MVAGLALLASVLSGMLVVRGRCARQAHLAERRRQAITAADTLLANWWSDPQRMPRDAGAGVLRDGLAWRRSTLPSPAAAALRAAVVRLEVTDAASSAAAADGPLVTVDVLVPDAATGQAGRDASAARVSAHD